jgi:hypothetical protein
MYSNKTNNDKDKTVKDDGGVELINRIYCQMNEVGKEKLRQVSDLFLKINNTVNDETISTE